MRDASPLPHAGRQNGRTDGDGLVAEAEPRQERLEGGRQGAEPLHLRREFELLRDVRSTGRKPVRHQNAHMIRFGGKNNLKWKYNVPDRRNPVSCDLTKTKTRRHKKKHNKTIDCTGQHIILSASLKFEIHEPAGNVVLRWIVVGKPCY